jgi:hypothetical protein
LRSFFAIKFALQIKIGESKVSRKSFDYTQWRENLYEDKTLGELLTAAAEYASDRPELIPERMKRI